MCDLARCLSLAVQIESELIRAMRLRVMPRVGGEVESDLWFSRLVDQRDSSNVCLDSEVRAALLQELIEIYPDPGKRRRLERARQVVEKQHSGVSPVLRLEEHLVWAVIRNDMEEVETELWRALRAFESGRPGIARWATGAWARLPEQARDTTPG